MKTVVVLGSGRVAGPAFRTLLSAGHRLVVATDQPDSARDLLGGNASAEIVPADASSAVELRRIVRRGDAVVSLLPASMHPRVAEACLAERRPLVTTSYVSEEMRALDGLAKRRGLLFLNEIGCDPGIDHMQAVRLVDRVRSAGGRVTGFRSLCGGLPAPEASDNPFRYKISWSPRGVALAGSRPARYLERGELVPVPRLTIFDRISEVDIPGLGRLECVPNGDSLRYLEAYGLDDADTLFRGTLRWPGWSETWSVLCRLGFVDDAPGAGLVGRTYAAEMRHAAGAREGESTRAAVARAMGVRADAVLLDRLEWLGLFAEDAVPKGARMRLDLLVRRMEERMTFREGERDLLAMFHEVTYVDSGGHPAVFRASLVVYGTPGGESAMARTVGLPAGFATRRLLDGTIRDAGVRIPVTAPYYEPLLADLAAAGIQEQVESAAA
ncbi:MAG: saccharopine dehydrogenase C-terminal domain-containing protein [bacterium]